MRHSDARFLAWVSRWMVVTLTEMGDTSWRADLRLKMMRDGFWTCLIRNANQES